MSQPAWLEQAWAELGEREIAGETDNPRILALYRDAGAGNIAHDEIAWCAAFVGASLERAGIRGTRQLLARSYLQHGVALDEGRPGAIVVLSRGNDPALGHVGFWLGDSGGKIYLLGGNQGNAVSVQAFERSRLLGIRWPEPEKAAPRPSSNETAQDSSFDQALAHVLKMEGGWSEDPYDSGGPTNFGITLADFARWRGIEVEAGSFASLRADLKTIDPAAVRDIYTRQYWHPSRANDMPPALAIMHFDAAVNHGLTGAARMLQQAVGVAIDGEIGPMTLSAVRTADVERTVAAYAGLRRAKYRSLSTFWRFGRGWLARTDATERLALSIARTHPRSTSKQGASEMAGRTQSTQAQPAPGKWWGESMTIWGVAITTLSTVLPVLGPFLGLDISAEAVRQIGAQATAVIQAVGGLIGTLLTVYGRARAATPLVRRDLSVRL